ncbi:MAG: glycosyltransferase family 9 protein [Candidatus Omnitrophica bacterium]|nr:glycosyltransferase family 9 protein [Candidatus Omnitrophota bacterium]
MRSNLTVKTLDRFIGITLGVIVYFCDSLKPARRKTHDCRKILLIKFCCLGDAVLTLPAIRALRHRYRNSEITMLCTPRTHDIYEWCSLADKIITFGVSGQKGKIELFGKALLLLKILIALRREKFDIVIDFDNYYTLTTIIGRFAGAPVRVGFASPGQGRKYFLTHRVNYTGNRHMVEFYADLVRALGIDVSDKNIDIASGVSPEKIDFIRKFLRNKGYDSLLPLIAIGPGRSHNWHFLRWDEEKFVKVAKELHNRYNAMIVIVGGKSEREIADRIMKKSNSGMMINAVAMLPLDLLIAMFKICDLFICNDSGPMHIAAGAGTPTLAVFGPANHVRWGPYGSMHRVVRKNIPCSPCLFMGRMKNCASLKCVENIEPEEVVSAASRMLEDNDLIMKRSLK